MDSLFCRKIEAGGHQKENHFSSLFFFSLWFENQAFQASSTCCLSVAVENRLQLLTDVGCLQRVMIDLFSKKPAVIQHILNVC